MRQNHIMAVLLAVLCLAAAVLGISLIRTYRNVNWIPESAVEDLCRVLAADGIELDPAMVPRQRENGTIYMSDGAGYEENAALLLAGSDIKSSYMIPDGQLFLHYNGDITEFTEGFQFRYRKNGGVQRDPGQPDTSGIVSGGEVQDFAALTEAMSPLSPAGNAALAAAAFLNRQDEILADGVKVETVIAAAYGTEEGLAYVQCRRQIDGVEITDHGVICRVEAGVVTEAAGKWCFMTFGESYVTQLSDITNILFMMKRTFGTESTDAGEDGTPPTVCTVTGLERCYSLYFFSGDEGFCLIPCWRVETDRGDVLVYSGLDGTLYTKISD